MGAAVADLRAPVEADADVDRRDREEHSDLVGPPGREDEGVENEDEEEGTALRGDRGRTEERRQEDTAEDGEEEGDADEELDPPRYPLAETSEEDRQVERAGDQTGAEEGDEAGIFADDRVVREASEGVEDERDQGRVAHEPGVVSPPPDEVAFERGVRRVGRRRVVLDDRCVVAQPPPHQDESAMDSISVGEGLGRDPVAEVVRCFP